MPKNLGESVADYLLRRKFGALVLSEQRFVRVRGKGSTGEAERLERELQPLWLYRGELRGKSPAELAALEAQEMANEEVELFGARADLAHWSKMADWTLEQALALSFERNPGVVNWTSVAPHVWWSKFAQEYSRVRDRALSHVRWHQLFDPVLPAIYLAWAKRDGFGVSAELVRLVEGRGLIVADWKDLYEKMLKNRDELGEALREVIRERDAAERRGKELETQLRDRPQPEQQQTARWPWGGHNTKLLDQLAAAGERWWRLYDPSDPTSAPINDDVVAWLKERNVAGRVAEVMAQLLRADGLRTGPRR